MFQDFNSFTFPNSEVSTHLESKDVIGVPWIPAKMVTATPQYIIQPFVANPLKISFSILISLAFFGFRHLLFAYQFARKNIDNTIIFIQYLLLFLFMFNKLLKRITHSNLELFYECAKLTGALYKHRVIFTIDGHITILYKLWYYSICEPFVNVTICIYHKYCYTTIHYKYNSVLYSMSVSLAHSYKRTSRLEWTV